MTHRQLTICHVVPYVCKSRKLSLYERRICYSTRPLSSSVSDISKYIEIIFIYIDVHAGINIAIPSLSSSMTQMTQSLRREWDLVRRHITCASHIGRALDVAAASSSTWYCVDPPPHPVFLCDRSPE